MGRFPLVGEKPLLFGKENISFSVGWRNGKWLIPLALIRQVDALLSVDKILTMNSGKWFPVEKTLIPIFQGIHARLVEVALDER